jgi:hypothetical protein
MSDDCYKLIFVCRLPDVKDVEGVVLDFFELFFSLFTQVKNLFKVFSVNSLQRLLALDLSNLYGFAPV